MWEFTAISARSRDLFGRSAGFSLLIGDRPLGFSPSREYTPASLPNGLTREFSVTSCHYVQENKVTYNFWKKFTNDYLIESKRVNAWRQAADVAACHYVIEKKMGYLFFGEACQNLI